jgi:hypothetical protein
MTEVRDDIVAICAAAVRTYVHQQRGVHYILNENEMIDAEKQWRNTKGGTYITVKVNAHGSRTFLVWYRCHANEKYQLQISSMTLQVGDIVLIPTAKNDVQIGFEKAVREYIPKNYRCASRTLNCHESDIAEKRWLNVAIGDYIIVQNNEHGNGHYLIWYRSLSDQQYQLDIIRRGTNAGQIRHICIIKSNEE